MGPCVSLTVSCRYHWRQYRVYPHPPPPHIHTYHKNVHVLHARYVSAGLSLLGHAPLRRNTLFDTIASSSALWEPTVAALLERDEHPSIPYNISSGCGSGYDCAQNIASLMSWQIMTNSSFGGLARYADFVRWYYHFLTSRADPVTGLWCEFFELRFLNPSTHRVMSCHPSALIIFIFACMM